MAKSAITKKNSIGIKGILNIDVDENKVVVEVEDGGTFELATLLVDYNGSEVTISVGESIDIA